MKRVKVVTEPTDLVPLLRIFDTPTKRALFRELAIEWQTAGAVEARHGKAGLEALDIFEKSKIIEAKYETVGGTPQKCYRSTYTNFQLNFTIAVQDMGEIIGVASMPAEEMSTLEGELWILAGAEGAFLKNISDKLGVPMIRLQCALKRSTRLDLRGHIVVRRPE